MGTTEPPASGGETSRPLDGPVPEYVDWIVGAVVALGGLALLAGGSALTFVVDRAMLREDIQSGEITVVIFERELTEAQMLDFTSAVVNWTGIGLVVTGVGLVVFAVGFVAARRRAQRRTDADEPAASDRASAVYGAVATSLLSFLPFSPVLGGGVSGYLSHRGSGRSVSVGALGGFLAMLPGIVILLFVTVGLFSGLSDVGETGLGIVVGVAMVIVMLFVAAYGAGLGALGGFAGGRLAENRS